MLMGSQNCRQLLHAAANAGMSRQVHTLCFCAQGIVARPLPRIDGEAVHIHSTKPMCGDVVSSAERYSVHPSGGDEGKIYCIMAEHQNKPP